MKRFLWNHVKSSETTYWPSILYWNGLLQSILGLTKRLPAKSRLPYQREILSLSDGGEVALDFLESEAETNG
jgi:abhydrolase domain-containing protein 1/3